MKKYLFARNVLQKNHNGVLYVDCTDLTNKSLKIKSTTDSINVFAIDPEKIVSTYLQSDYGQFTL